MRVLVHLYEKYLIPKGGAGAVCYYYKMEQNLRGDKVLYFLRDFQETKKSSQLLQYFFKKISNYLIVLRKLYFPPHAQGRNYDEFDVVHFHDTNSLYYALEDLKNYKGIVLLQSHSPQPLAEEQWEKLKFKYLFPFAKQMYQRMDRLAFERADFIIFPCPESEEPYKKSLEYFNKLHNIRPNAFKYVLTGIPASLARRDRQQVCEELKIPISDFIITYVGRHNEIKGFDLLKSIANELFLHNSNMWIISAGKEEPLKRLDHHQWKEIGWTTDAHSYIQAADVFILPNRETYFDIVMLEVLSLGKIVVASRTGGNKYFERNNLKGVFLYDTIEEAIEIIQKISMMPPTVRYMLGEDNKEYFNEHLNVSSMYNNYIKILNEVLNEKI